MQKIHDLIEKLCPNGVKYKNIQELCKISRGKVMSKDFIKSNAGEYPVYSSQTENNGELGKISTYDFDGEYLTWTTDGANAGSVFYRKGKFSVTNVCGLLEIKSKVMIPKFLYYVLSIEAPKYVNVGMGNPKLMSNVMAKIRVAVPPLEVQCEIVHILDDFTLLSAELSAELKARQKQYEYYKNKIFNDVVSEKTEFKKLNELTDVRDGTHDSPKPVNAGKYLVTSKNIKNGTVNFDGSYLISEKDYNLINQRSKVDKNDLLFTMIGTIGEVGIVEQEPDYAIKNVGLIKTNNILLSKFLFYYLTSNDVKKYIENNKSKGSQVFLALGKLRNIPIPVLSDVIVEKIVNILEGFDKLCNDISEGLPAEIEARQKQYEYYRDKLLTFKELKVNE